MVEPFKNFINPKLIKNMSVSLKEAWTDFGDNSFTAHATDGLEELELKARSEHITDALVKHLPDDFIETSKILLNSLADEDRKNGISGWAIAPITYYVALKGKAHLEISMKLLKEMTKRFTAEFDIRFFIMENQDAVLEILNSWLDDPDHHVRRLISEGTRPRLPWGLKLQTFVDDPRPIIPLLEALKDDEEEYVRRSVANNLNDIAKDHPDLVADIAAKWLENAGKNRTRLVKHACRTLIKQGHKNTLKALGYDEPQVDIKQFNIVNSKVVFGTVLEFGIEIKSTLPNDQNIIIDYAIHHRKANGNTSPKVFKWKTTTLKADQHLNAIKKHKIVAITTRVYYPGIHSVEILINGKSYGRRDFELIIDK